MIIPVRCFSCGKVVGNLWNKYQEMIRRGSLPGKALTDLGLTRYCCRRMLLTHVEIVDLLLLHQSRSSVVNESVKVN